MSNQGVNSRVDYNLQQYPMQGGNDALQQAKQSASNNYVNKRLDASKDMNPVTRLGLTMGIGYGIGQAMDYFGPKCEGQYEKTILGKLGGWGDKFSQNTALGRFIEKKLVAIEKWMDKKAQKPGVAYTLEHSIAGPSKGMPWNFARMPWLGLHGFLSADMQNVFEQYTKPIGKHIEKLEQYDKYKGHPELLEQFKNSLKGKASEEITLELQKEELRCLGVKEKAIARYGNSLEKMQKYAEGLKVQKILGFKSVKQFKEIIANISEHPEEVMKALEKATANGKDFHVSIWRGSTGFWGKLKSHFFGRKVSLSEYLNKYKAALGKGNSTHLGRALPKYFGWLMEGMTNRFAGGKLAPFMQAMIFADTAYYTFKAPKGEHFKTMAERLVNDFSYFIAMTLGLVGLYKVADFKNIGLTVDQIKAKYADMEIVNTKNANREYNTKKLWKEAKKAVIDKYKPQRPLKWYEKILKKAGDIVDMGNRHFKPYRSPKKLNKNLLRRMANTNVIGVPLRLWLVMAVATPVIVKTATKAVHLIFGKPTNSVLDEDKEEEEKPEQKLQNSAQNPQTPTQTDSVNPNNPQDSNLIRQTVNNQTHNSANNQQYNNSQVNSSSQNQNQSQNNGTIMEPVRTYIPSPTGYVPQEPDMSPANTALAHADKAEQQINQIMATVRKS